MDADEAEYVMCRWGLGGVVKSGFISGEMGSEAVEDACTQHRVPGHLWPF
jgi:hypothetical protein